MTNEIVIPDTGEIVQVPPNLFNARNPLAVIEEAGHIAAALAQVIEQQKLYVNIQGKKYVRTEGWTLLGSMLGVFPICTWTRAVEGGWEARVEARTLSGVVVGAAEAQCTRQERTWASRDDYALRSMAQTRATSKALRLPLGFVVTMAGYVATPADEVPAEGFQEEQDRGYGICPEHGVGWFQTEKMRSPAHPTKDGWCNKPSIRQEAHGLLVQMFPNSEDRMAWLEHHFPAAAKIKASEVLDSTWVEMLAKLNESAQPTGKPAKDADRGA